MRNSTASASLGADAIALLQGVTKKYGQQHAVDDISLELRPGEVVALLGPNGAGKTTTVRLLLGLTTPTSGSVRTFGGDPRRQASRMRVGAMLQVGVAAVPALLTVGEHLDLFRSYYPAPMPLSDVVKIAGLEGLERVKFGKLSGGQKQRLMFGLALCGNPDLLSLDEPTVGMDIESRHRVWDQIRALSSSGKTVLLTTHYLEEADRLADRILVLQQGSIVAEGTPSEIKGAKQMREIRCRTELSVEFLLELASVSNVRREGSVTVVSAGEPEAVVRAILAKDPTASDLAVSNAALEDAFLALTSADSNESLNMPVGKMK
jgi:ABC-2 type transport system ATP-binding protein